MSAFRLRLKSFLHLYESGSEERCLDEVDNVIWILPFLALLDIVSTFYATGQGYSLGPYEGWSFFNFFVVGGSVYGYLYAVIYMLIIVGIAYLLWHIKNKVLEPSRAFDKGLFIILLVVVVYIYAMLTAAFLLNFFLPEIVTRGVSLFMLTAVIYLGAVLSLGFYLWSAAVSWVRSGGSKRAE
jgi:hypothetical protein